MDPRLFAAHLAISKTDNGKSENGLARSPGSNARGVAPSQLEFMSSKSKALDLQTPPGARTASGSAAEAPTTPEELESNGTTPRQSLIGLAPSFRYPAMNRWRVLVMCLTHFANGLQDGATGALIPYMERDYHVGYAIVSLIFITNAVGFIVTAAGTEVVQSRLGRARSLMLSEVIMAAAYVMIVTTPPFAVVVLAYLFIGLGYALNLAMNNVFAANLTKSTIVLGISHGAYGIGGLVGPLVGTALVSKGIVWSRFYLILLVLRVIIFGLTGVANRGYEAEPATKLQLAAMQSASGDAANRGKSHLLRQALGNKITLLGALFIFAYQGAEVSISGWVISFLISTRDGIPSQVGYVTSGFWGGITLGRFTLVHLATRFGERRFVPCLTIGCVVLQVLVWLVPNIIGNAVAVSLLGFLMGPVYPSCQTIFAQLLPRRLQMSSVSFISSAGSSGGAIAPLLTGLLAQASGTFVLHPICIALFAVMLGCWFLLPAVDKRDE